MRTPRIPAAAALLIVVALAGIAAVARQSYSIPVAVYAINR
ncbi:hypothetical protein [Methylobacterium sp.]|nr:hypothetical protein [Methylobacterium sp.]